ncbi:PREDICTED: protein takeout-like [Diuraphis noxia]|uniref:protein takeout-like n=1 Tax=Diuraphis noxia TaxID=143948 RepID=UPI000763A127|nr:PREDICTED: protein takeout-like [Diuraphis noxia]
MNEPAVSAKEFVKCQISDLAFNECVRAGLQSAIPQLAMGVPSLGLLKMDPLRVSKLGIDQGTPSIKLSLNFKDLDIINMRSLIIKKAIYDPVNYSMLIESEAQKPIILQGLYEMNGQILVLPIIGNGRCKISLENFKLAGKLKMTHALKNGTIFLVIQDLSWKFTTSRININFDNLFNGNKVLGDHMNIFLNENWRELFDEMQSAFEQALSSAFIGIIQQFLNQVPLNQIFNH